MEEVFRGKLVRMALEKHAESSICVVTFSNYTGSRGLLDHFGEGYLHRRGFTALHVVAVESLWWQTHEMVSLIANAQEVLKGMKQSVVVYGSSMGGFGALMYASQLGACRAIVASPQATILQPDLLQSEWLQAVRSQPIINGDATSGLKAPLQVGVIYDPFNRLDRSHVKLIDRAVEHVEGVSISHYLVPFGSHNSLEYLRLSGLLSSLITPMIGGNMTVQRFRQMVRENRKDNIAYSKQARMTLRRHGKERWSDRVDAIVTGQG